MVNTLRLTRSTGTKQPCNAAENGGGLRLLDVRRSPRALVVKGLVGDRSRQDTATERSRALVPLVGPWAGTPHLRGVFCATRLEEKGAPPQPDAGGRRVRWAGACAPRPGGVVWAKNPVKKKAPPKGGGFPKGADK